MRWGRQNACGGMPSDRVGWRRKTRVNSVVAAQYGIVKFPLMAIQ